MRITLITRISVKATMILHMQVRQLRREGQQSDIREPSRCGQYLDQFDATGVSGRLVPVRCRSRGKLILDLGSGIITSILLPALSARPNDQRSLTFGSTEDPTSNPE